MTQRILVRTRLRAGSEAEYERIHAEIPADLRVALTTAGVIDWQIWRDEQDLIHLVTVRDYRAMRKAMAQEPANDAWQAIVNPLLEAEDDYSGNDDGIPLVWSFRPSSDSAD